MYRKGQISTIDSDKNEATVVFQDLDNSVSGKVPMLTIPINNADFELTTPDITLTGKITIDYKPKYNVNDWVIVAFFGVNFNDGVIIGKIGG